MNAILYYSMWFISVLLIILGILIIPISYQYMHLYSKYLMYRGIQYFTETQKNKAEINLFKKLKNMFFVLSYLSIDVNDDESIIELKNKMRPKIKQLYVLTTIIILLIFSLILLVFWSK